MARYPMPKLKTGYQPDRDNGGRFPTAAKKTNTLDALKAGDTSDVPSIKNGAYKYTTYADSPNKNTASGS